MGQGFGCRGCYYYADPGELDEEGMCSECAGAGKSARQGDFGEIARDLWNGLSPGKRALFVTCVKVLGHELKEMRRKREGR